MSGENQKILLILLICLFVFGTVLNVASATVYTTLSSAITPTYENDVTISRTISAPTGVTAYAMIFTPNATDYLHFTEVYLRIGLGSPSAWLQMALCNVSGGSIGDTIAGSQLFYADSTSLNASYVAVDFPYVDEIQLTSGANYSFVLFSPSASVLDINNYFYVDCVDSTASSGSMFIYGAGSWVTYSLKDMKFRILALDTPAPTLDPSATPNPTVYWDDPTPAPDIFGTLASENMVVVFIAIIGGAVGFYFAGIWGFFGGLNLTVVMLYVGGFMPIWVVITLLVIDGFLLFNQVNSSSKKSKETGD